MIFNLWGESEESLDSSWSSFENRVELILKERTTIHLDQLLKLMWGGYNLLTNYQGILEGIKHLAEEGRIIINDKQLSLAIITVFEDGSFVERAVWDIIHKEKEIEKKKEISHRYNQVKDFEKRIRWVCHVDKTI